MRIKINDLFYKIYLKYYLANHPKQLKNIDELKNIPSTFLVISNTALGDLLLSTPAIKSLKKSFPDSKIIALIHKNYIPMVEDFKYIDQIIPFYGGWKKFFHTIGKIKKFKPQIALIFHGNGPQDVQLAIYSGCEYILKHTNNSPLKKYLSYDFKKEEKHIIEERVDLVRKIGGQHIDTTMELPTYENPKLIKKFQFLKDYIGFQVGASELYRAWPTDRFVQLAKLLLKDGKNIAIIGIEEESFIAEKIIKECKSNDIVNLCGKTTIEELPYAVKNLKYVITPDTGTMHLAIALKIPTICLYSPSNPNYTGPYQDRHLHHVIKKNGEFVNNKPKKQRSNKAMEMISVNDVYKQCLSIEEQK